MVSHTPPISPTTLSRNLLVFARALRVGGIAIDPGQIVDFQRALALIDGADGDQFYRAARAVLVQRLEDLALFDRVFALFWREVGRPELIPNPQVPVTDRPEVPTQSLLAVAEDPGPSGHETAPESAVLGEAPEPLEAAEPPDAGA